MSLKKHVDDYIKENFKSQDECVDDAIEHFFYLEGFNVTRAIAKEVFDLHHRMAIVEGLQRHNSDVANKYYRKIDNLQRELDEDDE